jgi:hypothetical protein
VGRETRLFERFSFHRLLYRFSRLYMATWNCPQAWKRNIVLSTFANEQFQ